MIEAVLFDVAGVLLVPHRTPITAALSDAAIRFDESADFERAHYAGISAIEAIPGNDSARPPYLARYVSEIGVPRQDQHHATETLLRLFDDKPVEVFARPGRGVPKGLWDLLSLGVELAVVSNSDGSVERQLRTHQICQVGLGGGVPVLGIVDSHVVGVQKPDPRIFEIGLEATGTDPSRSAYVGDSCRFDMNGAEAAGMVGLHFDPFGFCNIESHRHFRSMPEVASWIQERNGA